MGINFTGLPGGGGGGGPSHGGSALVTPQQTTEKSATTNVARTASNPVLGDCRSDFGGAVTFASYSPSLKLYRMGLFLSFHAAM